MITTENLPQFTEEWLHEIARYNHHAELLPEPNKTALLVVDMQNYFISPEGRAYLPHGAAIVQNVKRLMETFRRVERPVIFTRHVHKADGSDAGIMGWWWNDMIVEGEAQSEIFPEAAPLQDERVILKHRYSAFYQTELDAMLRSAKVEDLVIAGVMTNLCCESTARDANFRDYRVFLPADATGASSEEMHLASLKNLSYGFCPVTTTRRILQSFE
ncbi:cysteine hydrolase [bacterium]|nr:cysteine hydrolase [bacterium]